MESQVDKDTERFFRELSRFNRKYPKEYVREMINVFVKFHLDEEVVEVKISDATPTFTDKDLTNLN